MSDSSLIEWFECLLFGGDSDLIDKTVDVKLLDILSRLQSEGIRWRDFVHRGGLIDFYSKIHADLFGVLNHFENGIEPPLFKTRVTEYFFRQLSAFLARQVDTSTTLLPYTKFPNDFYALESILSGSNDTVIQYTDATFWGETARHMLDHRRPMLTDRLVSIDSNPVEDIATRLDWLYDLSCQSLGRVFDPLTRVMVPASEHVDAVVWSSSNQLEAFLRTQPTHPLSRAVISLVEQSIRQILNGEQPSCSSKPDKIIDLFLTNISVVHDTIVNAETNEQPPPKAIDVFQRLLALTERDYLWKQDVEKESIRSTASFPEEILQLSERINLLERQNRILTELIASKI